MSFLVLPPEINSALLLAGAGSGPLLESAAAWEGLSAELGSAAESFSSVTSGLVGGSWQGASAASMAAAAMPYAGWLSAAAASAESAAGQARAVVGAFEAALAATVHPTFITANRSALVSLAVSNLFGQNTPAIAAAESDYELMWAQDVAAMAGYHLDASAVVSALQAFTEPARTLAGGLNGTTNALAAAGEGFVFNLGLANVGSLNLGNANIGSGNAFGGNIGDSNLGWGNIGSGNFGLANIGLGNVGFGNSQLAQLVGHNIGFGNAGSNNFGFGNSGMGNIGIANSGTGNMGIGLAGDHQSGIGSLNTGSGNMGLFNSGNGNVGLFNSGTGNWGLFNSGSHNSGIGNSGQASAGLFNAGIFDTGLANAGVYNSGAFNPGDFNTGVWNTGTFNTGILSSSGIFPIRLPLDLTVNGGLGPITIQPIQILPTIPLNFDHTFMLGPLTVPDIQVPAIPLAGISIPVNLGPLTISPITLFPGLNIPGQTINVPGFNLIPGGVTIPQIHQISTPTDPNKSPSDTFIGPININLNVNPFQVNLLGMSIAPVNLFPSELSIPDTPIHLDIGLSASTGAFTIPGFSLPEQALPLMINVHGQIDGFSTPAITTEPIPAHVHAVISAGQPVPIFPLPAIPLHIDVDGSIGGLNVHPIAIPQAHASITNASIAIGSFTLPQIDTPLIPLNVTGTVALAGNHISAFNLLDPLSITGQSNISTITGPSATINTLNLPGQFAVLATGININPQIAFAGPQILNMGADAFGIPDISIPAQIPVTLDLQGGIDQMSLFSGGLTFPVNSVSLDHFSAGFDPLTIFPSGFRIDPVALNIHSIVLSPNNSTTGSIGPFHIPAVPAIPPIHVSGTGNVNLNLGFPTIPTPKISGALFGNVNYGFATNQPINISSFGTTGSLSTGAISINIPIQKFDLTVSFTLIGFTATYNGTVAPFSITESIPSITVPLNFATGPITILPLSFSGSTPLDIPLDILSASTIPGITHLQQIPIDFSLDTSAISIPETTIPAIQLHSSPSSDGGGGSFLSDLANAGPQLNTAANAGVAWLNQQLMNAGLGNAGIYNLGFGNLGDLNFGAGNIGTNNLGGANIGVANIGFANSALDDLMGHNIGFGNTGSGNIGFGNTGSGNIGFGNTGNNNQGIGLIGDNQNGFGGWNSGSGNVGLFNSGTDNFGLFNSGSHNSGFGNSGQGNTGLLNAGLLNNGLGNAGDHSFGAFNAGSFDTGALNPGNANTGLLNIGNFNTGVANSGNFNTGLFISGNHSIGAFFTGDSQGSLGINLFDINTNLGPVHFDPIHVEGLPIDIDESFSLGPFTIPQVDVPAIPLDIHQSLTLPAVTLYQGLNMPAQIITIPINVPAGTASTLQLPVLTYTITSGTGVIKAADYFIGQLPPGVDGDGFPKQPTTGLEINFGASGAKTGSVALNLPAINIPQIATTAVPLTVDVHGGVPAFTLFDGGLSIPENPIPVDLVLKGGLQPFDIFPNGYTIDPIPLHLRLDFDLVNPLNPLTLGQVMNFHLSGGLGSVTIPDIPIPTIPLGLDAHLGHGAFSIPSIPIPNIPVEINGSVGLGPIGIPSVTIPAISNNPLATIHFDPSSSGGMTIPPFEIWTAGNAPWDPVSLKQSWIVFGSNIKAVSAIPPVALPQGGITVGGSTSGPFTVTVNGGTTAFTTPAIMIDKIAGNFGVLGGMDPVTLFPDGLQFPANNLLDLNLSAGPQAFTIPARTIQFIGLDLNANVKVAGTITPPFNFNLLYLTADGAISPASFPSFHIPSIPLGFNLGGGIGPINIPSFSTPVIHLGLDSTVNAGPVTVEPFSINQLSASLGINVSDMTSGKSLTTAQLTGSGLIGAFAGIKDIGGESTSKILGFNVGPFTVITPPGGGIPGFTIPVNPIEIRLPLSLTIPSLTFPGLTIPDIPLGLGLSGALPAFDLPSININRIPIHLEGPLTLR